MKISAVVQNSGPHHEAAVATAGIERSLSVPGKPAGGGSAVNGGEFLMLALATCYCNDLCREARSLGIPIAGVEVEASAELPGVGLAATNIGYRARVSSSAPAVAIEELIRRTDAVAEIHHTLRTGVPVTREKW